MTLILNLTQHPATTDQQAAGVVDLPDPLRQHLKALLTFDEIPTPAEIEARASRIAELALHNGLGGDDDDPLPSQAMIGGAPFLMSALEASLRLRAIAPLYAFSRREVVERPQTDGSVTKQAIFRHLGLVSL